MRLGFFVAAALLALSHGAGAQAPSANPPTAVVCEFPRKAASFRYVTTVRLSVDWSRQFRTAVIDPRNSADPFRRIVGADVWEGGVQISNSNRNADTSPIAVSAIVSRQPAGAEPLVFYWLHEHYPMVVRADWSRQGTRKDATFYDSQRGERVEGTCR